MHLAHNALLQPDRRRSSREPISLDCELSLGGRLIEAEIVNLSVYGALVHAKVQPIRGMSLVLRQNELGNHQAHVIWVRGERIGLAFETPLAEEVVHNIMLQC